MRLNTIAKNQTEIIADNKVIFFSYNTPVAANIGGKWYKTEKKFSSTTTRHINKYLSEIQAELKPQEFFDNLI